MKKVKEKYEQRRSTRQLKAMLRKNWLLKIRHPFVTCAEILLPTVVMLLLIAVRFRVDTRVHPLEAYIRKDMLVEVGKSLHLLNKFWNCYVPRASIWRLHLIRLRRG